MVKETELDKKNCLLYKNLDLLAKKWSIFILLELTQKSQEPLRYTHINKVLSGITPRILSRRLNELVTYKLVKKESRKVNNKLEVYYSLTKSGRELKPILEDLRDWGRRHKICNFANTCKRCTFN